MKKIQMRILVLLAFVFLLASCGSDDSPAPTSTPVPTDLLESDSNSDPGPASLDLTDPEMIKEIPGDYEIRMDFSFIGAQADGSLLEGDIVIEGSQLAEAAASSLAVTASGAADLGGVDYIEIVELDDRLYIFNEVNGCVFLPLDSEEDSLFNNLVDTAGFLTGTLQRASADEIINGVPSYHFAITQENLDSSDPEMMDVTTIEDGSLYIAKDGAYVVRLIIRGEGTSDLLTSVEGQTGEIDYRLDFVPADGLQIIPPEGCEAGSGPDTEYPVLADAQKVAAFGALYSYESSTPIEAVLDFYKSELAAKGWVLDREIAAGDTAVLLFTLGDRNLSIAITGVPDSPGTLSIVIAEEK